MIHVFVGTKAQFIKMAPILHEFDRRGVRYNFIDAGQHAAITGEIVKQFDLQLPDVHLRVKTGNINTLPQAIFWSLTSIWRALVKKDEIFKKVFKSESGVCLIHGDTLTTLISLLYAKRCGINVAHVEAGLRSYSILDPFPEELIRLIAMKFSDVLFAPSEWAQENLTRMGYSKKTINIGGNTIIDAIHYAKEKRNHDVLPSSSYVLVTIHRVETIYSRKRMEFLVSLLDEITDQRLVYFILHDPTKRQLEKFDLLPELKNNQQIRLLPLQPYLYFVNYIDGADFVITDGGSIQEETYYLNKPCLILRKRTERCEGIGENAVLSNFDRIIIMEFVEKHRQYSRKIHHLDSNPSKIIADHLLRN